MMEYEWDTPENGQDRTARDPEVGIGGDIDFRVESSSNPAILNLTQMREPEYHCPTHGDVSEIIRFDVDGEDEVYCIRCWREWFRNCWPALTRIRRDGED